MPLWLELNPKVTVMESVELNVASNVGNTGWTTVEIVTNPEAFWRRFAPPLFHKALARMKYVAFPIKSAKLVLPEGRTPMAEVVTGTPKSELVE